MAENNELVIKINGDVKGYQDALKEAQAETKNLQKTFNTLAKTGAVVFTAFVGTIALTTTQFAKFEDQLLGVKTLLDESSFSTKTLDEGFKDLSKGALEALSDFPLALESINKSLFDIVSAGIPAADAIDVLGSTSRLAVAGITESAIATDAVTTAINAYGLSAKESEVVASKFFTAQKFGKTTIAELSRFMGEAVASAAAFGVSLDELLASTAAATTGGIRTNQAFTAMTAVLSNISKPTADAAAEAERLGIEFNSTSLRAKGLAGFLDELTAAEGFNQQSIEKLFASIDAQKLAFSLTGAQAAKFKETLNELTDSQKTLTTFTRAYEEQSQSLKNQTAILRNNFQALAIQIGANLAPLVSNLAKIMTGFLKFLQDNPGVATLISKLLVMGTVTAGLITTVGLLGLGFLKLRAALIAARLATTGLTFAVKALVGSTGIGLLIAFLPELIQLFDFFFGETTDIVKREGEAKKKILSEDNKEIEKEEKRHGKKVLKIKEEQAKKGFDRERQRLINESVLLTAQLAGVEKEQVKFLKRRQAIKFKEREAEAIEDVTNRALALNNVKLLNQELNKEEEDGVKKRQEIADKKDAADKDKADKQKERDDKKIKRDAEKLAKEEEQTNQRIVKLAAENEAIRANQGNLEQEEIAFLARRRELRDQEIEADKIKNETERQLALENITFQNDALLEEEAAFFIRRDELKAEQTEKEAALNEELNQLSATQRAALRDQELEELQNSLQTQEAARSKAVKKELLAKRKEAEIFAQDEEKFGARIAKFKAFQRSENLSNAQTAANALSRLQQSESKELAAIGKAAALVQIAIDTQRGALAAFTALSGIPIIGPALGAVAAAALIAFGAERAAKVQAAQAGGIVGGGGLGDRVPFLLEPGELITPRQNFEEVITAVTNQRAANVETEEGEAGEAAEAVVQEVFIGFDGEEAADVLTIRQNEQAFLGVSQRIA